MNKKPEIYYIGNAHLDHTWLWRWTEGQDEVHATFRAALERMETDNDYVFTSAVALHYKWIEDDNPEMFKEIQKRVKEGRWQIAGGWWVQPDNNIPSGESFAREGLYGQLYFKSRFGIMAETGYCVDSFGHNGQLPQILQQQGMKNWLAFRPEKHQLKLPAEICLWQGIDGTEVIYSRPPAWYCSTPTHTLEEKYEATEKYLKEYPAALYFYGVGDHGGGATTEQLDGIREYISKDKKYKHIWGNMDDFYKEQWKKSGSIPVYKGDLQYAYRGCYTTIHELKDLNRLCESKLYSAEALSALAAISEGTAYAAEKISDAWKEVLTNQFHDIICGTCSPDATEDSIRRYCAVIHSADAVSHSAARKLTADFDTRPPKGYNKTIALSLVNPLSRSRRIPTEIHPIPHDVIRDEPVLIDSHGNKIECQNIHPIHGIPNSHLNRILFTPEIPACGADLFHAIRNEKRKIANKKLKITSAALINNRWKLSIDRKTGNIKSLYDNKNKVELIQKNSQLNKLLVLKDLRDSWGTNTDKFDDVISEFKLKSIKILEKGPLRAAFEIQREYGCCFTRERIALYRDFDYVDFSMKIIWTESFRMLKLAFPFDLDKTSSFYEIPFGTIERPVDGTEQPMHRWVELRGKNSIGKPYRVGVVAKTTGAADVLDSELRLTLVRSPLFAFMSENGMKQEIDKATTDAGIHNFEYRLYAGTRDLTLPEAADDLHIPHEIVWEGTRRGTTRKHKTLFECKPDSVHVTALKRAEDGDGYIIRLYETRGKKADVKINGPRGWKTISTTFKPYEIQTFRWKEKVKAERCNMLEL